jgi:hypothetical protein
MLWKILIPIFVTSLIGWGAWTTVTATSATPRVVHDKHVEEFMEHKDNDSEKFDRIQQRVEDKLDKIQQMILDLHKGE